MSQREWHVLGAGAIGCLFASALSRSGCSTTLLLRKAGPAPTVPVQIVHDGATSVLEVPCSAASDPGYISHLLVTTKAQHVCEAVLSAAHRLDSDSQVVLLANGLGFAEELVAGLPGPVFYSGTTTEGAYRLGERHVCHAGRGLTRIGRAGHAVPPRWFKPWSDAIRPSVWDPDIERALWLKFAINCVINPLTALHGCRNGGLMESELAAQVQALCAEVMQVSAAVGLADVCTDLHGQVMAVIRATADNQSSMLQDVLAGRGTEIEYITGHLLRLAKLHGVAAPKNVALYQGVLALGN